MSSAHSLYHSGVDPGMIRLGSGSSFKFFEIRILPARAVDPHSFFSDPDPAVFLKCGSGC